MQKLLEEEVGALSTRISALEKRIESQKRQRDSRLSWEESYWNLFLSPFLAFIVMGIFFQWIVKTDDAWLRAFGTVIAFVTYTTVRSYGRKSVRFFHMMRSQDVSKES